MSMPMARWGNLVPLRRSVVRARISDRHRQERLMPQATIFADIRLDGKVPPPTLSRGTKLLNDGVGSWRPHITMLTPIHLF